MCGSIDRRGALPAPSRRERNTATPLAQPLQSATAAHTIARREQPQCDQPRRAHARRPGSSPRNWSSRRTPADPVARRTPRPPALGGPTRSVPRSPAAAAATAGDPAADGPGQNYFSGSHLTRRPARAGARRSPAPRATAAGSTATARGRRRSAPACRRRRCPAGRCRSTTGSSRGRRCRRCSWR